MIADWKHTYAIEIKSKNEAEKKQSLAVKQYKDLRNDGTKAKVYYLGDISIQTDDVQYVSWKDWGKEEPLL